MQRLGDFFFILILTAFVSCSVSDEAVRHQSSMEVTGRFIKVPFENKVGKVVEGIEDYFFEYNHQKKFVKWAESSIKPSDIEHLINKIIRVQLVEKNGLWDTDNPEQQSRVGDYVCILSIL